MSVTKVEATLEAMMRDCITEVEIAIYSAKKHGMDGSHHAHTYCGALTCIPLGITLDELELEVLPEIKKQIGI